MFPLAKAPNAMRVWLTDMSTPAFCTREVSAVASLRRCSMVPSASRAPLLAKHSRSAATRPASPIRLSTGGVGL